MKNVRVLEIAKELDLDTEIIHQNLLSIIEEEQRTNKSKKYLFDNSSLEAFVFEQSDLDYINNAKEKEQSFLDLVSHFDVDSSRMKWILENLLEMGVIEAEVLDYLREVKDKPSLRAYYEPESVKLGEEAFLVFEVNTEIEIQEPKINLQKISDIDILYSPSLPEQINPGRLVYRYQLYLNSPGHFNLEAEFTGLIQGNIYSGKIGIPEFWVKSLPPEIVAEKIPRSEEVFSEYNKDLDLVYRITNRGKGEANSVSFTGISNGSIRIISGETIGRIAVKARIDHPVTIRPVRSGDILLDNMLIRYEDGDGLEYKSELKPVTIRVTTLKPELKIEPDAAPMVNSNEIFTVSLIITNIGKGPAFNLSLKIRIEPQSSALNVPFDYSRRRLEPGNMVQVNYELRAPGQGEVVLSIGDLTYFDEENNRYLDNVPPLRISVRQGARIRTETRDWPFEIGAKIDKYVIKEVLGQGGFATVYLVDDTIMRTKRAIKALRAEYIEDQVMVEEFINEARNSQRLQSQYIVQVFDVSFFEYKNKAYPYIVMEAIMGRTLRDKMIPGQPMDIIETCYMSRDVCDALLIAHQRGVIHLDIKPSNIFYDDEMVLWKLGDFGLAKLAKGKEHVTEDGTATYMAPEPNKTYKSDIYSLGLVIREMLTGTRKGNIQDLRKMSELREERTEELIEIVEQMTQMAPNKRPELREIIQVLDLSTIARRT